ncbi:MAG TPA: DUF4012 domain-containing protein [Acidimicrobiales bacterium]|nr:DUF4012 domain-containing protein [Acidimicrobiales bacterium]
MTTTTIHNWRTWIGRHRKGSRLAGIAVGAIIVLFAVALGLTFKTYEDVRTPLSNAQDTLTALAHNPDSLNTGLGRNLTEIRLATAAKEIASAQHTLSSSFGLRVLGVLPGLDTQRAGLTQLVSDLHTATINSLRLLESLSTLASHSHGTTISLLDLRSLGTVMGTARTELAAAQRSSSGLWGPIGSDRQRFDREDARAIRLLGQGQALTRYAIPFLGGAGQRNYLVLGENNAEMRDGGSILSYSTLQSVNGSLTESNGGSVVNVALPAPVRGVPLPAGTKKLFGELEPTLLWQSANAPADFPFTGRVTQAMFAAATGAHVEGVIGLDVVALQGLLALTGPVTVAGIPEPVTSDNAASVLLDQLYEGDPPGSSQDPRHEELGAVTSAAVHQLQSGDVDVVALARTLATEVAGRHLQIWDENPSYERTITEVDASGAVDTTDPTRTFHVAVENATTTKLDFFIRVSISDTVYVTPSGTAQVDTSVTLHNTAPAGQAPSYQLGPDGINSHVVGQYVGRVILWGPRGASQPNSVAESGLRATEVDLSVLPGQSATAQFSSSIPGAVHQGTFHLVFVPQARLFPETLKIHLVGAALAPGSSATARVTLNKTQAFTWHFTGIE